MAFWKSSRTLLTAEERTYILDQYLEHRHIVDIGGLDGAGGQDGARYAARYGTAAGFPNYLEKEWRDVVPGPDGKVKLKHRWCHDTPYRVIEGGTKLVRVIEDGESGSGAGAESLEPDRERSRSRGRGGRRGN